MTTQIQTLHFDADDKLFNSILEKVENLGKYYSKIENTNVTLRLERNNQKKSKVAEIELLVPGKRLFAFEQSEHFEVAVDKVVEELKTQLIRHKEKESDTWR